MGSKDLKATTKIPRNSISPQGLYSKEEFISAKVSGSNPVVGSKIFPFRFWRTIIFCGCMSGFLYQCISTMQQYYDYPSIVEVLVLNDGSLEFPSVTVCNNNRIKKSNLCELFPRKKVCKKGNTENLSEREIYAIQREILNLNISRNKEVIGHGKDDIFLLCTFRGEPALFGEECISRFDYFYDPYFGNCYSFNGTTLKATETDVWSEISDLKLVVNIETEEYLESNRDPGVVITFHPPKVYPDAFSEGIRVRPGHSYNFALQKTSIELLPLPYKTNCTDYNLLKFVAANGQRTLSTRLCTARCSQKFQLKKCNCTTLNISLYFDHLPKDYLKRDSPWRLQCAEREAKKTQDYCRSACRVPCKQTSFHVTIDSYSWFKHQTTMNVAGLETWRDKSWNETVNNLAQVRVYFTTIQQTIYKHVPKFEVLELCGRFGGYVGIWLGISLLAVWDFLEKFLIVITRHHKRKRSMSWTP